MKTYRWMSDNENIGQWEHLHLFLEAIRIDNIKHTLDNRHSVPMCHELHYIMYLCNFFIYFAFTRFCPLQSVISSILSN